MRTNMDYAMSKSERKTLKRICKRIVIQSPQNKKNITEFYRIMREAAKDEFTEDNRATLEDFLSECYRGYESLESLCLKEPGA